MTDMTERRITATKINADNLQIKLEEPHCMNQAQPCESTNHLKVYQMNNMAQKIAVANDHHCIDHHTEHVRGYN